MKLNNCDTTGKPASPETYGAGGAYLTAIYFFIVFGLAALPSVAVWSLSSIAIKLRAVVAPLFSLVIGLLVIHRFLVASGMSSNEIGVKWPKKEDIKTNLFLIVSGSVACYMAAFLYFRAFKLILPALYAKMEAIQYSGGLIRFLSEWARTDGGTGAAALCVGFFSLAILEECAFRGFLFNYLRRASSPRTAFIWNSVLFSLAHINPYSLIPTLLVGLLLTALHVRSKGLAVPVFVHFIYNLLLVYVGGPS